jgi:hypothetical protein
MAAETQNQTNENRNESSPPPTEYKPPRIAYRVARESPGREVLNTLDIFGERPFSI